MNKHVGVVGLFRDLRGIATATSTRRTYSLLFDWLVSVEFLGLCGVCAPAACLAVPRCCAVPLFVRTCDPPPSHSQNPHHLRCPCTPPLQTQYPAHMQAVVCCLEAFADRPVVTTPLLKFVSEFVFNKSQRLTFDSSSANGILLFREVGVLT